jgi:hypothetical protein
MGIWQTLLDVCPYLPIPLSALLFGWGLWDDTVRLNRRIAAGIKPQSDIVPTLYKIELSRSTGLRSPILY